MKNIYIINLAESCWKSYWCHYFITVEDNFLYVIQIILIMRIVGACLYSVKMTCSKQGLLSKVLLSNTQSVKTDKIIFYWKQPIQSSSSLQQPIQTSLTCSKWTFIAKTCIKSLGGAFKEKRDFFEKKGLRYGLPIMIPYLHEKI